jgi:alpha-glucosidase
VRIDPQSGALDIADRSGRKILSGLGWRDRGAGFRLDFALDPATHIFGLGDKMGPLDRRGRLFSLWNTDAYRFQESTDPLYKSIPFFLTLTEGRAAGLFLDDSWRTTFDFGATDPERIEIGAAGGPIDYYVFAGPDPKAVLEAYGWLTGTPPLPPLWAFGFQQSHYGYKSDAEIREVAGRLRRDRIPADVIWFDITVLDKNRAFTTDPMTFPDFPKLVSDLDGMGLRSVVITDLHLAAEPGYPPFDSGKAGDHFLKNPDGSLYEGLVWPGPSVFPDFTSAATRAWWGGLFAGLYQRAGVAGFWNDMNEPSVFKTPGLTIPDTVLSPGLHNVYGMLNSRATYEGLLKLQPDRRPFVMTRATYAGGQRYAVTWTGDNSATWNHLRLSTPQLLSLGLSGIPFAGDDLGGFTGTPSPDLLTEWIALGMFNPIARDHSDLESARQEVWVHGPAQEDIRRRFIETRYRLMPYIYGLAEEASRTGIPMMRPLFLEFPEGEKGRPYDLAAPGEFLWGPSLLVAPSPWPESPQPYKVLLPPGEWYDFWSGRKVEGHPEITPDPGRLPVYVRAGSIIPSQPLVQSTKERPEGPLTLDIYPGPDCRGSVYLDDGVTRAYRRGAYYRRSFACGSDSAGELHLDLAAAEGSYTPWWHTLHLRIHNGEEVVESSVEDTREAHRIPLMSALSQ